MHTNYKAITFAELASSNKQYIISSGHILHPL